MWLADVVDVEMEKYVYARAIVDLDMGNYMETEKVPYEQQIIFTPPNKSSKLAEAEGREKMTDGQQKINWADFEVKNSEDRIKVELGQKYELGFNSLRQDTIEVVDKENTAEGKVEVKKPLAVLILGVDTYNGKPAKKELSITSKKLIQTIKTYFERDMLFRRIFQLEKSGSGFQTQYQLIALQDKPQKQQPIEATV